MSSEVKTGSPFQPIRNPSISEKPGPGIDRSLSRALFCGLASSRLFRATLLTGIALTILFTTMSNPAGWVITTVTAAAVAIGLFMPPSIRAGREIGFELSALSRLPKKNYNEMIEIDGMKIFLGALPNFLRFEGEHLAKNENVKTVISINESWERDPLGLSIPYRRIDWEKLEVSYSEIDILDHKLLDENQLKHVALLIDQGTKRGNVYVHCRAGAGRSGMGLAAYLMRYQGYSAVDACKLIKEKRAISTIMKKLGDGNDRGLRHFERVISTEKAKSSQAQ